VARRKDISERTDAAQHQHRSADAVMITADVFNRTFWDTPTLRSYSVAEAVTELVLRCGVY
jgi:hypothetical protein